MTLVKFANNYNDLSTERGYQFEFYCNRCGAAYKTPFQASATGVVSEALDTVGGLLGGIFSNAASLGERVQSATWERGRDEALRKALDQVKPQFVQCPRCVQWVCREQCWNASRGLCKGCAPDLDVEQTVAEAERDVEKVRTQAQSGKKRTAKATCPSCGAAVSASGKFCPECGAALSSKKHCAECGSEMPAAAKFCPECGAKRT
ncbi:MAG: zinc ribbon domain-containing protein [Thermoflexales bacterium]|nr:zinc ribbon domain-containing protein [Thermoflexales bacterium]